MTVNDKTDVKWLIGKFLGEIPREYLDPIVENILPDVCEDVDARADADFNDDDVRLALGRVLVSRLGTEI